MLQFKSDVNILEEGIGEMNFQFELNRINLDKGNEISLKNF